MNDGFEYDSVECGKVGLHTQVFIISRSIIINYVTSSKIIEEFSALLLVT